MTTPSVERPEAGAAEPPSPPPGRGVAARLVASGVVVAAQWLPDGSVVRAALVFTYLLVVPGHALVELLGIADPLERWTLSVALSVALGILFSEALVLARRADPDIAVGGLVALTVLLSLLARRRGGLR